MKKLNNIKFMSELVHTGKLELKYAMRKWFNDGYPIEKLTDEQLEELIEAKKIVYEMKQAFSDKKHIAAPVRIEYGTSPRQHFLMNIEICFEYIQHYGESRKPWCEDWLN